MSRITIFYDNRLNVISGDDIALGKFYQIFDKEMKNETPDGEGLVFEWSEFFGIQINYTGQPNHLSPEEIVSNYINEHKTNIDVEDNIELND